MPSVRMNIPIPVESTVKKTHKGGNFSAIPSGMAKHSRAKVAPTTFIVNDGETPNAVAKSNGSTMVRRQGTATTFNI